METKNIIATFLKVINWAGERNKIAKQYGTDEKLYIAEIHTIEMIGQNPGILQRELCEKMGITKGRVSIIISNLEKKGLVVKVAEARNKKELPIRLTELGKVTYECHEIKEKERLDKINEVLNSYSQEDIDAFNVILEDILEILRN